MFRVLRYCSSHCLYATMTRLEEANGEVTKWSSVRWLGYLSGVNLLVGLFLGLFPRWENSAGPMLPVVLVLTLAVLVLACVLYYYFDLERLSSSLLHVCIGFLLGALSLLPGHGHVTVTEQAANYMLLTSVALRTVWALLERTLGSTRYRPAFLTSAERLELVGFAAAGTMVHSQYLSVMVLLLSLATVMVALRMKVHLALPNLVLLVIMSVEFFRSYRDPVDPFALGCFFGLLICDPLLDVYFSGLSVTERWQPFLRWRGLWRRLSLLPLLVLELVFVVLAADAVPKFRQHWLTVLWAVCVTFWAICHVVFIITVWGFHTKLSDCQRLCWSQGSEVMGLDRVMASKGMRLFCLISERLLGFTLVSTVTVAAVSWQDVGSNFDSMCLLVLPVESLFHGLFQELGSSLGGTCVGYAIVIPTNYCSVDGQPMLLPPDQVQELNRRSTTMLSTIQRFFAHHLIETFGCDYSTSGVTLSALQAKIKSFLALRTADGPRHDTYVIFYSGHTRQSGEWALAGDDTLRLEQLVDWWREKNGGFSSRLIVVLDCDHSLPWVRQVRNVEDAFVAVQGAELARPRDAELSDRPQLGDFAAQWVDYNCDPNSAVQWAGKGRAISAAYGVSANWGDYTLRLPSGSDVTNHWSTYFPRATYPVVWLAQQSGGPNQLWVCGACLRCLRRLKLNLFPPAVLDTGQGFKLVRS
ncbi:transmembrane protein 168-like [Neosynchiropus ocellatus]